MSGECARMVADGEGQAPPVKVRRHVSACSGGQMNFNSWKGSGAIGPTCTALAATDLPPLLIRALCVASFSFVLPCFCVVFCFFCFDGGCTFSSGSVKAVWLSRVTEHFAGDVSGRRCSGPASTFIQIHWANGDKWHQTGTDPR